MDYRLTSINSSLVLTSSEQVRELYNLKPNDMNKSWGASLIQTEEK